MVLAAVGTQLVDVWTLESWSGKVSGVKLPFTVLISQFTRHPSTHTWFFYIATKEYHFFSILLSILFI